MIRRADASDIETAVAFAKTFHAESVHSDIPVDDDALAAFMGRMIEVGAVFLSDRGIIGGVLSPVYFNPSVVFAAELFWWAPQDGRALREAFEAWAHEQGAAGIQFSGQVNDRQSTVEKLFRRAGYVPVETGYLKRI